MYVGPLFFFPEHFYEITHRYRQIIEISLDLHILLQRQLNLDKEKNPNEITNAVLGQCSGSIISGTSSRINQDVFQKTQHQSHCNTFCAHHKHTLNFCLEQHW